MKKKILAILLVVYSFSAYSYDDLYVKDAQLWFNLYIRVKLSDRWDFHFDQQDRFTNNMSKFELAFADFGFTYHLNKKVKFLFDYNFIAKKNKGFLSERHQFYTAICLKHEYRKWRFLYRNMFQYELIDPYTSKYGLTPLYYDRNKITIKYDFNKWFTFYVADEIYLPLNNPKVIGFDKNRIFFGLFYNVNRRQMLELYFMNQQRLQFSEWPRYGGNMSSNQFLMDFIYGIGYCIEM